MYNTKGIANIRSLGLVHKHELVIYNSRYGNGFIVHGIQRPTFKMTKAGLLYHEVRHLLNNNNNAHIMEKNSHYLIKSVEENKKHYTVRGVSRYYRSKLFQHINVQPAKLILRSVDKKPS